MLALDQRTDRVFQTQAIESGLECLRRARSTMIVMATGLGKTRCCVKIAREYLPHGRIMFIADRIELLEQARNEFEAIVGYRPDLEQGENHAAEGFLKCPVVCSMIQTQRSGNGVKRWQRFDPAEFSMVVVDEADLSAADSYRGMIAHYQQNPKLKLLGCTATPDRHDGRSLDDMFETRAFDYPISDAVAEAWLVPVLQKYLEVPVDLSGVSIVLGELKAGELRAALAAGQVLPRLVSDTIQYAGKRKTLLFADSIENAETITELFNRHELGSARIITGETEKEEERPKLISDFRAGNFQRLINVDVATRGFDVPGISCIVFARPSCSITWQTQALGRGTRTWPGCLEGLEDSIDVRKAAIARSPKPDLLVLDLVKNFSRKKLPTVADVIGGRYDADVTELADKMARESRVPCDLADVLEMAQRRHNDEIQAAAEKKEKLRLVQKSSGRDVDPFMHYGLARKAQRAGDRDTPLTDEQREKLQRWKIKGFERLSEYEAQQIIDDVRTRARRGQPTLNMHARLVKTWGMTPDEARATSYKEAHRIMDLLAANNWQRPKVTV